MKIVDFNDFVIVEEKIEGAVLQTLKNLAKKYKGPVGPLKKIYKKGVAAWHNGGHYPGTNPNQWAYARINAVMTKNGKARKVDQEEYDEFKSAAKNEAKGEYKGREVELDKPMRGDVAKSKVYTKDENGKVIKINFGSKGMRIKKDNPERRKSFRARHRCDTDPPKKWTARYWSCKAW